MPLRSKSVQLLNVYSYCVCCYSIKHRLTIVACILLYILCRSNAIDKILVSRGFTPRYTYKICVYLFSKENPSLIET